MPFVDIRPREMHVLRSLAGTWADIYVDDIMLPISGESTVLNLKTALGDPYKCLEAIFARYAFARRGKDRKELSDLAVEALRRTVGRAGMNAFLQLPDATSLWSAYVALCEERKRKPLEQLNRGVISGLAELAQEIYRLDGLGSFAEWIVRAGIQTDRIEPEFLRIVDIRGVGPKLTSVLMRDVVFLYGLEDKIDPIDRLYVQPIDKWARLIAPHVIDEEGIDDIADWILAGKLAKYTRRAGVSGIRFNMGVAAFGMLEVRNPQHFDSAIADLLAKA